MRTRGSGIPQTYEAGLRCSHAPVDVIPCRRFMSLVQSQKVDVPFVLSVPGGEIQFNPELGEIPSQCLAQLTQVLLLALARLGG